MGGGCEKRAIKHQHVFVLFVHTHVELKMNIKIKYCDCLSGGVVVVPSILRIISSTLSFFLWFFLSKDWRRSWTLSSRTKFVFSRTIDSARLLCSQVARFRCLFMLNVQLTLQLGPLRGASESHSFS